MDGQRDCWAETFLSIDPNRVAPVERAALLAVLPRRREMFESIGATAGELISAEETPLDERHTIKPPGRRGADQRARVKTCVE